MFQLLLDTKIDFMRYRRGLLALSTLLVAASVALVGIKGLDYGIEFTGGTELQLKYHSRPDVGRIRTALEQAGLSGQSVSTIGDSAENEVYVRVASGGEGEGDESVTGRALAALRGAEHDPDAVDLNVADESRIKLVLSQVEGMTPTVAAELARAVVERRTQVSIFGSLDELAGVPGMTTPALEGLRRATHVGPLAIRSQSYIGPAVGRELLNKAAVAILLSLAGMLIYIWIRFELPWGCAAVLALVHDTAVTLGLFALFDKEMSLPVVAAFLTLVGYSVNDTVVVFDRIRENVAKGGTQSFESTINLSINQTLSRTIITSGLTWVVCLALFLFGGSALNAFSFVLSVGIVVGTYSSISIASPLLILWRTAVARRRGSGAAAAPAPAPRATKVRSRS